MESNTANLITVPEAARRAGVARNTMLLAAKNGKIKAIKLGRDWLVDETDIDRWKKDNYRPDMAYRYPVKTEDVTEETAQDPNEE